MRVAVSWLREYVDVPADAAVLEQALVRMGLEVSAIVDLGSTVDGELVVGRVLAIEELTGFKKPIRYCTVDTGGGTPRGIVCGARNFAAGDLVVVALPGAVLPGGFAIAARRTYDRVSDGMICSGRELGTSDDHSGIIVLPAGAGVPGQAARALVGLDDIVVEVEITPDRGYCHSVRGLARELSHALGVPLRDPADVPGVPGATTEPPWPVRVLDTAGCDRFAARLVTGLDPAVPSPQWMVRRLATAGVRSISLAVDVTNYVMLELGQPMHAFDPDRLRGPLVVRRAAPGERLTTLDGVDRALDVEDMVICDAGSDVDGPGVPVSLAAVMGGQTSEMLPSSTGVLFEAAHWDPVMVSRTARRHRLLSEAAKRWERGVDPALALVALERAVRLLVGHAGGTVDDRILDLDHVAAPAPVTLDPALPSRLSGVDYPPRRVVELLREIGAEVTAAPRGGGPLLVVPPTWRPDLRQDADLVEEVVRLDGYDHVPSVLPVAPPGGGLSAAQRRRRTVGRALAEAGYVEVLCYPFLSASTLDALELAEGDPRRDAVRVANPLADTDPLLRTTLLPGLLATLRRNLGRGQRDLALYELGRVFLRTGPAPAPPVMGVAGRPSDAELAATEAAIPDQPWYVAAVLAGDADPAGWWGAGRPAQWADAVQAARTVVDAAGYTATVRAAAQPPWHPGRCAAVEVAGRVVGYAGELHPQVCAALEVPRRTCAVELDLDAVPAAGTVPAPVFSTYPPALIDVALVVDAAVPAEQVRESLVAGAGPLLESARLFDLYTGDQVAPGHRSLAYKLVLRAPDRTLTGPEALAARDAAVALAGQRYGAVLRGS